MWLVCMLEIERIYNNFKNGRFNHKIPDKNKYKPNYQTHRCKQKDNQNLCNHKTPKMPTMRL